MLSLRQLYTDDNTSNDDNNTDTNADNTNNDDTNDDDNDTQQTNHDCIGSLPCMLNERTKQKQITFIEIQVRWIIPQWSIENCSFGIHANKPIQV